MWYIARMDWQTVVRETHQKGLDARAQQPFEGGGIPFRLRPYINPEKHGPDLELKDGISNSTRENLLRTAALFRQLKIPVALIQSDARRANISDILALFGLPADLGVEEMQREYLCILNERFGGTMENLPPEVWKDTIITAIKGPNVMPFSVWTCYHGGEQGEVVWE